jgi:hypothetical protein
MKSVVGTVESIQGDTLTLKNKLNQTREFKLSDETKFVQQGKEISKSDVKEGDQIRAAFQGKDTGKNELHATQVQLLGSGASQGGTGSSSEMEQGKTPHGTGSGAGQPPAGGGGSSGGAQ